MVQSTKKCLLITYYVLNTELDAEIFLSKICAIKLPHVIITRQVETRIKDNQREPSSRRQCWSYTLETKIREVKGALGERRLVRENCWPISL